MLVLIYLLPLFLLLSDFLKAGVPMPVTRDVYLQVEAAASWELRALYQVEHLFCSSSCL